jgi:hypothetical protein
MEIGDIVLDRRRAGLKNPHRISMYLGVGMDGKSIKCLCPDGHISIYDKDIDLEVVGHLPITEELQKTAWNAMGNYS